MAATRDTCSRGEGGKICPFERRHLRIFSELTFRPSGSPNIKHFPLYPAMVGPRDSGRAPVRKASEGE